MLSLRTKHKSAKPVSKCQVLFITVGDPRCLEKVGAMYLPHPKFLGGLLQQKQVLSQILRIVPQWLVNRLRNSWKLMGKVSGHHAHRLMGGRGRTSPGTCAGVAQHPTPPGRLASPPQVRVPEAEQHIQL